MVDINVYEGDRETAWCPGCGDLPLRTALIDALAQLELEPSQVAMFTGIGQAAKMPHYLKINGFNGLHGRALPPALGMRIANPGMKVIVESGDGDTYGEGGNHFLHNIRRNPDIAHLVHDNQIYGLTKGQASPTTEEGFSTSTQPNGDAGNPFNPIKAAVALGASFVARSFVGDKEHLTETIKAALNHKGYALVDILQPCVSFNRINTYQWYKERVYKLEEGYDPGNYNEAFKRAQEWGDKIPIGIIYKEEGRSTFRERHPQIGDEFLVKRRRQPSEFKSLLEELK
ncbi:thiamine pyrophosphate-dependent enzyme [Halonatronum saccharophilum]|uniref:thiamine pyrophosphate-dependent enzyme n=1 Tax=Halonatronum saccharophilum TaxID=150060 RepID=UPI000485D739|nr:thiamine pyrophosphate-dependent enzyme [Halonatronum saccharophilum]